MDKPVKIRWIGKEYGKYLEGKVLVLGRSKNIPRCYGNDQGNFYIHDSSLEMFPNSWEEIIEESEEKQ
jgi:hypothetical protein